MQRNHRALSVLCLVLCLAMLLTGCGGSGTSQEDLLSGMKEFSLADGSASLYLAESWTAEDAGLDNLLVAGKADGSEAVFVFQFPRNSIYQVESIDDAKAVIEQSYQPSDEEPVDAFDIPGMSNVSVSRCTITSDGATAGACLVYGETDYAFYAIGYMAARWKDSMLDSLRASCGSFRENPPAEADGTAAELSDTVRWFNASYAVLTEINGWDYNRFAGLPANETTRQSVAQMLEQWWDVTDRASADETLDWILSEGHRTGFAEDMEYLEEQGLGQAADREQFLQDNFDLTAEEAQNYASWYEMYEQYGPGAIDGWDCCRALNLMSFYYLAGYYTEQEALDESLEIARQVQPLFDSWDDLMASYMRGYEYWAEESSAERQAIYEDLKSRSDNPYQVDFKLDLQKTW